MIGYVSENGVYPSSTRVGRIAMIVGIPPVIVPIIFPYPYVSRSARWQGYE